MNTKGAHQMFDVLLESYKLDEQYVQPFMLQLQKTFSSMNREVLETRDVCSKRIRKQEDELDTHDERFAFGNFDDDTLYHRLRTKKQGEIDQNKEQIPDSELKISSTILTSKNP
jgi:pyruvate/2-oxoacid:ferredoxin oxidoreductase alpha subunit